MALKFIGPTREIAGETAAVHRYNGVPTTDLDDDQLKQIAEDQGVTRGQLVKMLTQDLARIGPLYAETGEGGGKKKAAAEDGDKE